MASDSVLRFGRFEIDPAKRALLIDGATAAIGARAFDLLLALAERRERLVSKQELMDLVWPGVVVEEHNIATQISTLRKLLGADVITTAAGRGYRFVATPEAAQKRDAQPARHNLPEPRTRFIGREAALADLARVVPQSRLTTLVGIGGSGKTRLALQFAHDRMNEFEGVWFVDLAPLHSSERVASACAAALGLSDRSESALAERIAMVLAERSALLVLDNCEHVRAGAAEIADALLGRAGAGRILATSREALGVLGEQLYPVRALSLPATSQLSEIRAADAVRLFADRAHLSVPDFEISARNAAVVADICRRLDGIPLAIELAAARVAMLSVADIAARLADRFQLFGASAAGDPRQRTLLATIQWSYDQLAPAAQRLLRQLAVFAGGWTLDAATAVADGSDEYRTLTLLTALHDYSLLVPDRGGEQPRYRMLETVRQYAQQRLDQSGETIAARTCHAAYFLALAERAAPHLRGPEQPQWMARLREEQENLVAALIWCASDDSGIDAQSGLRLAAATARYWTFNGIELGCRLAQAALQRDRDAVDGAPRFNTLHALSAMNMHRGDAQADLAYALPALAMARRCGQVEWQVKALSAIGSALNIQGDREAALQHEREALALAEASGNSEYIGILSNNIAETERACGEFESAERGYLKGLQVSRAQGNYLFTAILLHNLVRLYVAAGRSDDARAVALESEQLLRGIGEVVLKHELLKCVAVLASSRGDHALAVRWWSAAQPRFLEAGYWDPKVDTDLYDDMLAASKRALGDAAFAQAEAAGRALDLDSAMCELKQWLGDW